MHCIAWPFCICNERSVMTSKKYSIKFITENYAFIYNIDHKKLMHLPPSFRWVWSNDWGLSCEYDITTKIYWFFVCSIKPLFKQLNVYIDFNLSISLSVCSSVLRKTCVNSIGKGKAEDGPISQSVKSSYSKLVKFILVVTYNWMIWSSHKFAHVMATKLY